MAAPIIGAAMPAESSQVGYFSMEVGLEPNMPTYSGGLGVLAGDTLRSAADMGLPMVGVSLLYRQGYFNQTIDGDGNQSEKTVSWDPAGFLDLMKPTVTVEIEGRDIQVRAWRFLIQGVGGHVLPVYFLDTDLESNAPSHRALSERLYGGDDRYRLGQEAILGIAGLRMLRELGYTGVQTFHMNEGHSALLGLLLMEEAKGDGPLTDAAFKQVRKRCVFTTHTPVPAGHDRFREELVREVLGEQRAATLREARLLDDGSLNMTELALQSSNYVNGVAKFHQKVSQEMFPQYQIRAVTNGVHAVTWTTEPFQRLFDKHVPEWRHDNVYLRYAVDAPLDEIDLAHQESKRHLFDAIEQSTRIKLDPDVLTLGFARRATPYKRMDILFDDLPRLKWMAQNVGRIQLVYGGKAHPRDEGGKKLIRNVFQAEKKLRGAVDLVYIQNYDMNWGKLLTGGVDIWLNTPEKTREASGTSGMKAALNGVPSLSVLDGWWLEGHLEGVTGWSVLNRRNSPDSRQVVAHSLYDKLERVVVPMYYESPREFSQIRRCAIALNGSFFNTQRMVSQYVFNAYGRTNHEPTQG